MQLRIDGLDVSLSDRIAGATLEREPFCHVYLSSVFPAATYVDMLRNLPPAHLYMPLNLRKWVRADGTSTRDQFYLSRANIDCLGGEMRDFWRDMVTALTSPAFKRAVFSKLAPDLAVRFVVAEDAAPDIVSVPDILLVRDTEDYRIKPHPDGLNKIVTMQFYLPPDDSQIDLGTSIYRRETALLGLRSAFVEVKRFPFLPNSGYAFAVSDSPVRTSWHGRQPLAGFSGVRNTLMVLFQRMSHHTY